MPRITPFLWFDSQAEQAAKLYTSVFKNSKIQHIELYPKSAEAVSGRPAGSVMTVRFQIEGQDFIALNGGPLFKFNESVSFIVDCEDQEEVDYYWGRLTADGGEESQCGWLKDKFGLSWQIVPKRLNELMNGPDKAKANRVVQAMLKMRKLDVRELEEAYAAG